MKQSEKDARKQIGKAVGRVHTEQGMGHSYKDTSHRKDVIKAVAKKVNKYIDGK